jgi:leucyl-tRNA synthetase
MAPVTPHIAEELWSQLGKPYSVHTQQWPAVDESATKEDTIDLPVQINGKLRGSILVSANADKAAIEQAALTHEMFVKLSNGAAPKKVIVVKGRLVSVVV